MLEKTGFPSTRYQGSKRKILDWLHENLKEIEFETVLDAFGGTASVSYLFKKMGKSVTYNDNLKFNYLIGKAIIENNSVVVEERDIVKILSSKKDSSSFISDNFKDFYYTDEENKWLDQVVTGIELLDDYEEPTLSHKKALCYYALFQACLRKRPFNLFHRKNLYIRTNDVKRNFGNKTTWEKTFESEFRYFVSEANRLIFDTGKICISNNESVFDLQDMDFDLVYFDPPYITSNSTNESSNYLKCYHFLEGISNYATWKDSIDYSSKNLRFKTPETNEFDRFNIYESLDRLFSKYKNSKLVLSYKIGGTPSIEELEALMRKYKTNIEVKTKRYKYALNKQNGNAEYNREILIIGT